MQVSGNASRERLLIAIDLGCSYHRAMNCTKCKTKAVIKLPRHHAAFCKSCFTGFVHDQVARAIKSEAMFGKDDRILVAVSGGKDSLALWDILLKLGTLL
jgi:hypothetical protein